MIKMEFLPASLKRKRRVRPLRLNPIRCRGSRRASSSFVITMYIHVLRSSIHTASALLASAWQDGAGEILYHVRPRHHERARVDSTELPCSSVPSCEALISDEPFSRRTHNMVFNFGGCCKIDGNLSILTQFQSMYACSHFSIFQVAACWQLLMLTKQLPC